MLHQLHFDLTTPVTDDRPVYITGNFCDWAIDLEVTHLQRVDSGTYTVDLFIDEALPEQIEYKYYRGGEGSLELDENGETTPNRTVYCGAELVQDKVPYWQHNGLSVDPTYLPIEQTLYFPYPGRPDERRVRVLLPFDYETSDAHYPVLYLNDGQNVVGEGEGFGSWKTEFRLEQLATRHRHRVIIVAIDYAGEDRTAEYTIESVEPGFGKGDTYLTFVTGTVKAHIDARYRTLPDVANTGMGGSSLGGLITVWAGLAHPNVFGRWLVFSPALWISRGIYRAATETPLRACTRVYLYGSESESREMVPNLIKLAASLRSVISECAYHQQVIDPNGRHEEWRWSLELPRVIEWLLFNEPQVVQNVEVMDPALQHSVH